MSWRILPKEIRQQIITTLLTSALAFEASNTQEQNQPSNTLIDTLDVLVCLGPVFVREDLQRPVTLLVQDCHSRDRELIAAIDEKEGCIEATEGAPDDPRAVPDCTYAASCQMYYEVRMLRGERESVRRCCRSAEMVLGMLGELKVGQCEDGPEK